MSVFTKTLRKIIVIQVYFFASQVINEIGFEGVLRAGVLEGSPEMKSKCWGKTVESIKRDRMRTDNDRKCKSTSPRDHFYQLCFRIYLKTKSRNLRKRFLVVKQTFSFVRNILSF